MGDTYPRVKVAAVQAAPVFLDREATVRKACHLIEEAGDNGAKVIVFPECYIPAFPHWFDFYIAHDPVCFRFNTELFKNAVVVPSPATTELTAAAKRAGAFVVMGINEREASSYGTLYNAMLFLGPDGEIVGKRRKLVPTLTERLVHTGGDGGGLRVFPTPYGGLSGLICGENTNYLAKFSLLAGGEIIHAASWPAFPLDTQKLQLDWIDIRVRSHAFEGKVFVVSSCGVFSEEMKDALDLDAKARQRFIRTGGHSSVVSPAGQFIAGPLDEGEGIAYAEIVTEEVVSGRLFQDLTGHYNRFDVFTLHINRQLPRPIADQAAPDVLLSSTHVDVAGNQYPQQEQTPVPVFREPKPEGL